MTEFLSLINKLDNVSRCRFCSAIVDGNKETDSTPCMNVPFHTLEVPCREVMARLADPKCDACEGSGLSYHFRDRDSYEGYKMASKKWCHCIAEQR